MLCAIGAPLPMQGRDSSIQASTVAEKTSSERTEKALFRLHVQERDQGRAEAVFLQIFIGGERV